MATRPGRSAQAISQSRNLSFARSALNWVVNGPCPKLLRTTLDQIGPHASRQFPRKVTRCSVYWALLEQFLTARGWSAAHQYASATRSPGKPARAASSVH